MTNRDNERQVLLWMNKDLHTLVRIQAAKEDTNIKELICKALKEYLEKEENKNN